MHDIKTIREEPQAFIAGLKRRGIADAPQLTSKLLARDKELRDLLTHLQQAQARRNDASKLIGQAKAKKNEAQASALLKEVAGLKDEIQTGEQKERELTEELKLVGNMILAPGGGWIGDPRVVSLLHPPGRLIYLRVRPVTALARLGPDRALRPLLSRPEPLVELERLYRERRAAYEAADETVDTELFGLQRVIELVAELASFSE